MRATPSPESRMASHMRVVPMPAAADVLPPEFSEDAIALAFTAEHTGQILYVAPWGQWLRWDGACWKPDDTLAVFDLVRRTCRRVAKGMNDPRAENAAKMLATAKTVAAVERLAKADRAHARSPDVFDTDPWALNTPGGVIDLRTGRMRPHQSGDLFTKVTAVAPAGDCPAWRAFVHEIVQGDAEAAAYLQRWAGYCLTGSTQEHAFAFLYGPGGNGKGVFVNTLGAVLGDYATTAPMETFMVSHNDRHPTDLAGLRGARLVLAQETEAGRILAEARIKALTGGDRIAARFMRGDFFEFTPAFKLVMVGNHRPVLRNPDDAMQRRLHLLPLTFRPETPDPGLPERLKAERPGILAWALEGCLAWQRQGLGKPAVVASATAEYFAEQNLVAQWLAERCVMDRPSEMPSAAAYRDWKAWTEARGEAAGSGKSFSAALERHHAKKRTKAGAVFPGLRLLPSDTGVV